MKTTILLAALATTLGARAALADEPRGMLPVVKSYDAPPECPSPQAFAASVQGENAVRPPSHTPALQVSVVIRRAAGGYSADATARDDQGNELERTVNAPTCDEVAEITAAVVALAQTDSHPTERAAVSQPSPSTGAQPAPPLTAVDVDLGAAAREIPLLSYSFSLGYGAFAAGPATPVIRRPMEQTTFNPGQGVRLGFGASHAFGSWTPSLEVGAAYYRQGTTTVPEPLATPSMTGVDMGDRDVLQATLDACPVRLEYRFLSLRPCATFSMIQSRGNSGNRAGLETGLGGSLRVRGTFARTFFVEGLGSAVGVTSAYDGSSGARLFYALSLGVATR